MDSPNLSVPSVIYLFFLIETKVCFFQKVALKCPRQNFHNRNRISFFCKKEKQERMKHLDSNTVGPFQWHRKNRPKSRRTYQCKQKKNLGPVSFRVVTILAQHETFSEQTFSPPMRQFPCFTFLLKKAEKLCCKTSTAGYTSKRIPFSDVAPHFQSVDLQNFVPFPNKLQAFVLQCLKLQQVLFSNWKQYDRSHSNIF